MFKKSFREIERSDASPFHLHPALGKHCYVLITIFKNHHNNLLLHLPYQTVFVSWEVLEIPWTAWHTGTYGGKAGSTKLKSDSVVTFYGFRGNAEAYLTLHQIAHLVEPFPSPVPGIPVTHSTRASEPEHSAQKDFHNSCLLYIAYT